MPSFKNSVAVAGAFAAKAYAHGLVSGFNTDGTYNQGYILDYYYAKINTGSYPAVAGWYEESTDNGYIAPSAYAEPDIICNKNADNADTISATVSAGGTIDFYWTKWPDSHIGPILTYAASCGTADCNTVDKTTLEFFKIDEVGIDLATQEWPTAALIANNNTYSMTVPSTLASGNYVFRHEIIAMHGANSEGGAQNYPFCMNIAITGGGSDTPAGTLGTALYTPTDPGILFNPYSDLTEYDIPGPALYTAGSSGSSSGSNTGSSAATPSAATPSAATPSAASPTKTGSAGSGTTPTGSGSTPSSTGSAYASDDDDDVSDCVAVSRRRAARRHARDVAGRLEAHAAI